MRQRIVHGAEIDTVTPAEMTQLLNPPMPDGRDAGYSALFDVVMGDFDHPEPVLLTSPPARRLRITRHGRGGDAIAITTALTQICLPNEGRMGLQIVNYGTGNLFVYLAAPDDLVVGGGVSVATIWLKASGGSWDGEFAECLWGGSVTVRGDAATTISLAEM